MLLEASVLHADNHHKPVIEVHFAIAFGQVQGAALRLAERGYNALEVGSLAENISNKVGHCPQYSIQSIRGSKPCVSVSRWVKSQVRKTEAAYLRSVILIGAGVYRAFLLSQAVRIACPINISFMTRVPTPYILFSMGPLPGRFKQDRYPRGCHLLASQNRLTVVCGRACRLSSKLWTMALSYFLTSILGSS